MPVPLQWLAYALIGVQVGLRFTRASLASIARMLPTVLLLILAVVAATAGLGALLAALTPVDGLTAYLATSPGGADSVAIIAANTPVDLPFVMAMQAGRFMVVMFTGPPLARWIATRPWLHR